MNKLHNYILKKLKPTEIKYSKVSVSTYYKLCSGHIIRVSDHVGKTSDGVISIIYTTISDSFVVYYRENRTVSVMSYEQIKQLINTIQLLPGILGTTNTCLHVETPKPEKIASMQDKQEKQPIEIPKETQIVDTPVTISPTDPNTVFGLDINVFKPAHKKSIKSFVERRNPQRTGGYRSSLLGTTVLGVDAVYFTAGELKLIYRYVQSATDRLEGLKKAVEKATNTAIKAYGLQDSSMYVYGVPLEKFSEHQQELIKNMAEQAKINQQNNPDKSVKGPFILGIDSRYYTTEQRIDISNFIMTLPK